MRQKHVPSRQILGGILQAMKQARIIHARAKLNTKADGGLRKEVAIADIDFKQFLQRGTFEEQIVDGALDYLRRERLISKSASYSKSKFLALRKKVKEQFKGSWSSLSPQMERLLFALTAVKKPQAMHEFGCFWGNTLAWFCGPVLAGVHGRCRHMGGCDIDPKAIRLAKANFRRAFPGQAVDIRCRDGLAVLEEMDGRHPPLDLIYIEAKAPGRKAAYREIVEKAYDKLAPGAWVIAHDTERYTMYDELADYLRFVTDRSRFSTSISFDIDQFGLELSVKNGDSA